MQIDPIEQWPRKTCLIGLGATFRFASATGITGLQGVTASARVHGGHQLETRRIDAAMVRAGNRDLARLQWLTKRVQRLGLEFRQFIKEQHAVMRQGYFAGARMGSPTNQRRHGRRMMGRPERPTIGELPPRQSSGDRVNHRHFQKLPRRQGRQDRRQPRGEHAFPGARRPIEKDIVPASRSDLQRTLGAFLSLDLA